ncbi:hypothetical protein ACIQ6Y_37155 [Streptomyces sp. NPDC096205]
MTKRGWTSGALAVAFAPFVSDRFGTAFATRTVLPHRAGRRLPLRCSA